MDWAYEIAENMRGEDDELVPFVCLSPIAQALRKARADGMREAAEYIGTLDYRGHVKELHARAAEIEKGNT